MEGTSGSASDSRELELQGAQAHKGAHGERAMRSRRSGARGGRRHARSISSCASARRANISRQRRDCSCALALRRCDPDQLQRLPLRRPDFAPRHA